MEPLTPILAMLAGAPTGVSATLGAAAIIVLLILKLRNHSLDGVTSISKMQGQQVEELITQNRALAQDLGTLRTKMAQTLEELTSLRDEVARLRYHLGIYENQCHACEQKPRGLP